MQEIDGASNTGVDSIRELRDMTRYSPARDRFKVWIIDEVHQISGAAFNALLKTLEEPPPRVKFIFATTEYHKIPETILSRCQQYDFRMISARDLARHLRSVADQERIQVSDKALALVARAAEGSARDALSLFDQVLAFTGDAVKDDEVAGLLGLVDRELLHRASRAIVDGSSLAMLELRREPGRLRRRLPQFRARAAAAPARGPARQAGPARQPASRRRSCPRRPRSCGALADALSEEDLLRGLDLLTRAEGELRNVTDPRVALDLVLLKLVQMRRLVPFAEVVARVERFLGGAQPAARRASCSARAARPRPARLPAALAPVAARRRRPGRPRPTGRPPTTSRARPRPRAPPRPCSRRCWASARAGRRSRAPLRAATARQDGDTLVLELPADFLTFAREHAEDYRAFARKAAGHALSLRIEAATAAAPVATAEPSPEAVKRQKLREEAEKEPAVQEALDLFDGRVVDVRETSPGREDA